jgi:hypothetical protein
VGKAQKGGYTGTSNLPLEVRWGKATLPAGDYTLRVDNANAPRVVYIAGEGKSVVVLAGVPDQRKVSNHSQLDLVETANGYTVQSLKRSDRPEPRLRRSHEQDHSERQQSEYARQH